MLLGLLLASKEIFLCFILTLSIIFKYILRISLPVRKTRLKLAALALTIGAPTTVANKQRDAPALQPDTTSKVLSA